MENVQRVKRRRCKCFTIDKVKGLTARLIAKRVLFNIQGPKSSYKLNSVGGRNSHKTQVVSDSNAEGPPVPIPNTEVKLCSGENTLRETAREDSSMLTQEIRTELLSLSHKLSSSERKSLTNHIGS